MTIPKTLYSGIAAAFFFALSAATGSAESSAKSGTDAAPCASVSLSPVSLVSLAAGSDEKIDLHDAWISFSLNAGYGSTEDDFGAAVYPNIFNATWERRYFGNSRLSGFFLGRYAAIEAQRLFVTGDGHPGYSTDSDAYADPFWIAGAKFGGTVGFRLRFGSFGVTPKIGAVLPLQAVLGLSGASDSEMLRIYFEALGMQCIVFGVKMDFFN